MTYETANAYYFRSILKIGGIESHLYYIAQKYGKYDITVFYRDGDPEQLARLRKYVRCIRIFPADKVICENLFCCFNREILDQCEAKNKYLVLHGDYLDMVARGQMTEGNLPKDDRINKYLGVSQHVCDAWEKLTGIKAELIGEPVVLSKESPPLMLLSATRLSAEKGWNRMKYLANVMDEAKIPYQWHIYTNSPKSDTVSPNIYFHDPVLDITRRMPLYDAYIQLSDNEGFCLSVVEALLQGVPCIVTDCPVFHEIGLTEENSIIINHDMIDIPTENIRNIRNMKFMYKQPKDYWSKYLSHKKTTYNTNTITVMATDGWKRKRVFDFERKVTPVAGECWEIDINRYHQICDFEKTIGTKLIEVIR